ncbi:hypothetical protein SAMN02745126_03142 [Enhydrobacter aerosaccus]|uniref:DUF3618 domain-containing protein n=1 Tax=Enhydrobacter aerosaccus TaxID=225324 RepID=A0A1T4QCJ5_9HYPH|nr:hypothetical protein [Enhydrobacter aerosaccus]SKA01510.1 hypothetical protein SAMN02745126_03142 [Enhydrobacter aerosaccus]
MSMTESLERQAETVRSDLSVTLEALRGSMTRTALTSGATALAKEGGATVARAAVRRASDNPFAALLIGAGMLMLLTGKPNGSAGAGQIVTRATKAVKGAVSKVTGATADAADTVGNTVSNARTSAAGTASQSVAAAADWTATKTGDAVAGVSSTAATVTAAAQAKLDKAADALAQGRDRLAQTVHDVEDNADALGTRLSQFAQEQPVLVAALAIAAGAALGAALPMTDAERRYLGPSGARVAEKGRAVAGHVADAAAGKAQEAAAAAADTLASDVLGDGAGPNGRSQQEQSD